MTHPHLTEILAKLRTYLEQEYSDRLAQVVLFGSQARGDAELDSDIDVMIILSGAVDVCTEIDRISNFLAALCLDYAVLISCIFTSEQQFQSKKDAYFFRNVHQQGVPV
ncbi:nucleotidyltransferase domain-containing protein [Phormidesmis priestleyi ULC007]|uniref:Nucleotidyltransferase domain-containing protein n=1 Tax=Phormidesmis priestleyi ULC007 TaxID=1920490 RepID=A0A2T1D3H1_9CYAN|nr:nucleotidyltransferase domain-containing protein [Phormidesmis priestleyi]PSB15028.1 nucleotidyltransferase domain-containing protein [Phormidesmis priestleyi ULC007]